MPKEIVTLEQAARLRELEAIVSRGMQTFVEVGAALTEIKDGKLYEPEYRNFEQYCLLKWKFSRFTAYNLINAAEVVANVDARQQSPTSEFQVRPLAALKQEPEKQRQAWEKAVESANGQQPTAKQVAAAVEEVRAEAAPEEQPPKRERLPGPSNGMKYAWQAIESLKMIQPNDEERDAAFEAVQKFINTHRNK